MPKTVLVFDFGASNGRAVLCRCEDGKFSLEEIHRFPNPPTAFNGNMCWDLDYLWEQTKAAISLAVFNGGFDAICLDTWGVDFGLVDNEGNPIGLPVHYRDSRTENIPQEVYKHIPREKLFLESGVLPAQINTMFQLYYLAHYDENSLFRAKRFLMMPDLFAYFLTGEQRCEYTEASTTGLTDPLSRSWNLSLIEALGIPKRIFPKIIQPGEIYGLLKPELAEEFRISQVPVFACGTHDTASAAAAVPTDEEDFLFVSCGTWTLFGTELKRPIVNAEAYNAGLTNEGGVNNSSMLLKNIMGMWLVQETRRIFGEQQGVDYSYAELEALANEAEPFRSFINPNAPEFTAPENMPQQIREYCRRTNQPIPDSIGEIMRCIYQSLAAEFAATAEELSAVCKKTFKKIHMIGGGTQSRLLCQLTADAAGVPAVTGPIEATALGNAMTALISMGEIPDLAAGRKMLAEAGLTEVYTPKERENWRQRLEFYRKLTKN